MRAHSAPAQGRLITAILLASAVAIVAAFSVARAVGPSRTADFFDDLHWTIAYTVGAVLGWMGYARAQPLNRHSQRWFAIGLTACLIGQLCWDVQEWLNWLPYPAPSDLLFMALGPCCAYGMAWAVRARQPGGLTWPFMLDMAMLGIATFAITMALYLPQTPRQSAVVATVAGFSFTMMLAPSVMAVIAPTLKMVPRRATVLLPLSLLVNGSLWMQWLYFVQKDTLLAHTWLYLALSVVSLAMGLGAYWWDVESSEEPAWERRCEVMLRLLPLAAVAGAAASVSLALWLPNVSQVVAVAVYISAAITLALAIARQSLMLLERDRMIAAEQHARDVESRFRTLFNTARDGLALLDASGRFLEVNPACTQLFGLAREDLLELSLIDLSSEERERVESHLAFASSEGGGILQAEFHTGDGSPLHLEISSAALPGDRRELFMSFRDVSERMRSEEARTKLEAQLRQSQKLEAIGTLASGIAHDFNNVVSAILGNVELAQQDAPARSPAQTSLNEIRKAGLRARELIRRIVTFARPQDADTRPLQLACIVEEAVQLVRATLPATVKMTCDLSVCAPPVLADSSQIAQVVFNLCANAYQAMPHHSGHIDVTLQVQHFDELSSLPSPDVFPGRYVCLQVTDDGCGMSSDIVQRIFEPFFTTKSSGEGSGLGLSIVHGIVRAHGGAIIVHSAVGRGTSFRIYLPTTANVGLPEPEPEPLGALQADANQHILYVDDEEPLVFLTKRLLERRGYRVTGFTDAFAALEAFTAGDAQFDLVITDQSMPGLCGTDLALQMLQAKPNTRIVLVSGYLRPEDIDYAKSIGTSEVVLKPNTADELVATVHRLLSQDEDVHEEVTV